MSTKTKKLHVDRIEEGLAVAFDEDGACYSMCQRMADIKENDILLAEISLENQVISVEVLSEETTKRKEELSKKLKNLFNK